MHAMHRCSTVYTTDDTIRARQSTSQPASQTLALSVSVSHLAIYYLRAAPSDQTHPHCAAIDSARPDSTRLTTTRVSIYIS